MVNQLFQKFGIRGASLAAILAVAGCGNEPLSDEQTGYVDIVPFYKAGATTANPNAGLPLTITPKRGWVSGTRVEYYDFGPVGIIKKRNAAGSEIAEPSHANVNKMYFFFDSQGRPMFSKPAFDAKKGNWYMKGGNNPKNPMPVDGADTSVPYLLRKREILKDAARGSSQFQRPVINVLGANSSNINHTGLWEVVEIKVKDSGYAPDSIKRSETVERGIAEGDLIENRTGKVINCPIIDERTNVIPSSLNSNIPRPRIQVWYKTKLGECFLANGWETIGRTVDNAKPATDLNNLELYGAGDVNRLNTFDVNAFTIGSGQIGETQQVTAAVSKRYVTAVNDELFPAFPKRSANDPEGYSPIAWHWNVKYPAGLTYKPGSIRDVAELDMTTATANASVANNIAILGAAVKCTKETEATDCKWGMQCNLFPDESLATTTPPLGENIIDLTIAQEGGPRCDVPLVGYGKYCSSGISRCEVQSPAGSVNEGLLKDKIKVTVAGPTFSVHADATAAQKAYDDELKKTPPSDAAVVAGLLSKAESAKAIADHYISLGYSKDFSGFGYWCYPPATGTGNPPVLSGFCHIRCDSVASSSKHAKMTVVHKGGDTPDDKSDDFQDVFEGELRCGGLNLLGYKCVSSNPERQRVCMRACNSRNTRGQNQLTCDAKFNEKGDAFSFFEGQAPISGITGQICGSAATTCDWNTEFEPRDPAR